MSKKSKAEKKTKAVDFAKLAAEQAAQRKAEKKAAKKAAVKKAAKKAAVKAERKAAKKAVTDHIAAVRAEQADEPAKVEPAPEGGLVALAAAEKVLADPNAAEAAKKQALKIKGDVLGGMTDDDLKARVQAKQAERKALEATRDEVDRDDEQAVRDYNRRLIELGGGHLLTSNAEREARAAALEAKVETAAADPEVWGAPAEVEPKPKKGKGKKAEAAPEPMVAEVVATEEGDVIAVGPERPIMATVADDAIALPSEAPKTLETNGRGQYLIKRLDDGRLVGYTRATTYINNLEDTSALEKWKARLLLEGAAIAEVEHDEYALVQVRDLVHRRDVAITKAHRADRKGKLEPGDLGRRVEAAWSDFKKGMGAIAERMLEVGGVHEKAQKGTDLHALCELADLEGINAVQRKVEAGEATDSDFADVRAYLTACSKAGLKMVDVETVVVNDDLKVAGRLDRIAMYKPEGRARGTKVVADVKTGRIDYGAGKIAQQIALYASGQRYDLETHERSPLGVSKTLGLLIHLPAGTATCTIYEVDLALGAKGVKLSGEVRAWRNEGKRALDLKAPIATASLATAVEA